MGNYLICIILLTVNLFGYGLITKSKAARINIDQNEDFIELSKRENRIDTLDLESVHFRYIRDTSGKRGNNNWEDIWKIARRFVCRLNFTEFSDIDGDVILDAIKLMGQDVKTCPLEQEFKPFEVILKTLIKNQINSKNIKESIDKSLRQLLSKENLGMMKELTSDEVYKILEKIASYYEKNQQGSFTEMLSGMLCKVNEMDINNMPAEPFKYIINSIDKKAACSKKQQKEILEKFVRMFTVSQWINPKNILRFFRSDFKTYAKLIGMSEDEIKEIITAVGLIDNLDVLNWTVTDISKRILCHITETNFTMIDDGDIMETMTKMIKTPECTQSELEKKWSALATSFGLYLNTIVSPEIENIGNEINTWSTQILDFFKNADLANIKMEVSKAVFMINEVADKIISNVENSRDKDWNITSLMKNVLCNLNITENFKGDEKSINEMLNRIGNLDTCNEKQQDEFFEMYMNYAAKYSYENMINLNKTIGNINIKDMSLHVTDLHVQALRTIILFVPGLQELDKLIGIIWQNMKKYPTENLNLEYMLKFLSCNLKKDEIENMDLDKLMKILSKFGQPLQCNVQDDWLKDLMNLVTKILFEMNLQQLKQLDSYIGTINTKDFKDIAKKVKHLKNLAMSSFNKVFSRSDEWISHIQTASSLDMSVILRELICFSAKANISSLEAAIVSFGEFGGCTKSEAETYTKNILETLKKEQYGDLLYESLIGFGIFTGKFDINKMQALFKKVMMNLDKYSIKLWEMSPQELKNMTITKVLNMISKEMEKLDEMAMCAVRSVVWSIFGQPYAPDINYCFFKDMSKSKPGNNPGGKLDDRYKVGADFPFAEMIKNNDDPETLLKSLITFNREANTEKEKRILHFVTKRVISYLLSNPDVLEKYLSSDKKRIFELATQVNLESKIISRIKIDSDSFDMMKNVKNPQLARRIVKKAIKDMEFQTKPAAEKKKIIEQIPSNIIKESGTEIVKFLSDETKDLLIQTFKQNNKKMTPEEEEEAEGYINEEEDEEEAESLARLILVHKLTEKTPDTETMASMMDTSLVTVISIKMLKKIPQEKICSMKTENTDLRWDQIQFFVNKCPKDIEKIAKTDPSSLGKLATKVTRSLIESLNLDELIKVTFQACKYENRLDIDLEKVIKNHYLKENLNPMEKGAQMYCVLKYIRDLPWDPPLGIKICKTLGKSLMNKIPPKEANFFKDKCMNLLKSQNLTFSDMRSMNPYLTKDDIKSLRPETMLQGAVTFARYVNDASVFSEVGKKISELKSLQDHSTLTADNVAQDSIFIAAWSDADTIPKASILQSFQSLAKSVDRLQKKKNKCLTEGRGETICNTMDNIISKIVQLLIQATTDTDTRKRRSTVSCRCSNLVSLGMAAIEVPASQMTDMICATNFDECMEELSQITDWNEDHQAVFVKKSIDIWDEPKSWNSSHMMIASAIIPGLSVNQIKMLPLDSMDATFNIGKQNNWKSERLAETFLLFLKKMKSNNISSVTSFDLQALGNIVCGITVSDIRRISKDIYINAASHIGSQKSCSQEQFTAWAEKALAEYGENVNDWGSAEIASIGSVINGFSAPNLQKLNEQQITAIGLNTISNILPLKLAMLHPKQIGYLTTSQVQMVTPAQIAEMTDEQKTILNKKLLGNKITLSGGQRSDGPNYVKWLTPLMMLVSRNFVNLLS